MAKGDVQVSDVYWYLNVDTILDFGIGKKLHIKAVDFLAKANIEPDVKNGTESGTVFSSAVTADTDSRISSCEVVNVITLKISADETKIKEKDKVISGDFSVGFYKIVSGCHIRIR